MKIKLLALTLALVACNLPTANAATVTERIVIGGKTVFTFTIVDSLTLDPKGCKDVYIKYTMNKSYSYPNSFVMFGLFSKDKNQAQTIYVQPGNGKGTQGKDAWVGDKEMVFCGKAKTYVNEYGDKVEAPAFTKGKYTFSAKFTVVKPKLTTTSSKDVVFTVK
jgi:hypothetical protein